jgi:hypothetical protein
MSGGYYDPSPPIPHGAVNLLVVAVCSVSELMNAITKSSGRRSIGCDLLAARPQQDSNRGMIVGRES